MERRPLVLLSEGITTELPVGDTLPLAGVEPSLGNPASDGMVLSSTVGGTRSWVTPSSGMVPSNLVDSSITISFDTSYIVMDYLIVVSDFIVSGNVGVI